MKDNLKLVTIATTTSSSEAQLLKTILEDGGIEAYVQDEMAGQYVSPTGYRIQVEAQNVEAAKAFLAENQQYQIDGEPSLEEQSDSAKNPKEMEEIEKENSKNTKKTWLIFLMILVVVIIAAIIFQMLQK